LLTADVTSAAFYEACAQLTPTFLIDETGSHGDNRALRHLLRVGTTREVVAMRKNHTFHAYGAKVICWLEPPDDPALNTRCILIPMTEANRTDLIKPTDPSVEKEAADLRAMLLQFRFDHYKPAWTPAIPGAEILRPRSRDLLTCLAAPFAKDEKWCAFLVRFFELQAHVAQEPLSPPQNAVLAALFSLVHQRYDTHLCLVGDLTGMVNKFLEKAGEHYRLLPRKVGAVLTSLGITERQRTKVGLTVWLDRAQQARVHRLAETYGLDHLLARGVLIRRDDCRLCQQSEGGPAPSKPPAEMGAVEIVDNMAFLKTKHGLASTKRTCVRGERRERRRRV